ncbi:MAG: polysaccharide deacetylase family protein [Burkholderiales bacterium]|nr:polysaccharide deacetylase family protein [Burkholderiales bacterium]
MANPRVPYRFSTDRAPLAAPRIGGRARPLIVHVVVNVEHWQFNEPMPRKIITPPHGKETEPDVPNFSWADYGMRAGLPRIMGMLEERGITASTSFNAGVIDAYPRAAEAMRDAGWEFIGHGMHQKSLNVATADGKAGGAGGSAAEEALIRACLSKIEGFTGERVRGWLSPGLRETYDTPDVLKSCGVEYVCDWVIDDLPDWMTTRHGPLIAMPYNLEINDSIVYAVEKHASPEMWTRLRDTVAAFGPELRRHPRVLALGLHPHLIGVPHRIGYLAKMLDLLKRRDDVVFMQGGEIADWYAAACPAK